MSSNRRFVYYVFFSCLLTLSFILFAYHFSAYSKEVNKEKNLSKRESQLKKDREELEYDRKGYEASVNLIVSHETASKILEAKKMLKDVEQRSDEFSEGLKLCLEDVESIHSVDSSTVVFRQQYCKDRALKYLGYDTTFEQLRSDAIKPYPSDVIVRGLNDGKPE